MNRGTEAVKEEPATLDGMLRLAARTPNILVACDYDGTLAPIVANPDLAVPVRESMVALRTLASQPNTHVAVISGRSLTDLAELTGLPTSVHLVGSHGSEFDAGFAKSLSEAQRALHKRLVGMLSEIASAAPGFLIETKPASVAFHYRNAPPEEAERAVARVNDGPASLPGVFVKRGRKVIEIGVVGMNKGTALEAVRTKVGASMVVFIGDDVTDEDAFATLSSRDVGIKVGSAPTCASHRLADPQEVARWLARLVEIRSDWLLGADTVPIERHSMLSDMRTAALVTPQARVTYLCVPRLDSSAIFAEVLGGPAAGHFSVSDAGGRPAVRQAYVDDSLVLRTEFPTFSVTDFLDCSSGLPGQLAGRTDLVRILEGTGRAIVEFAPRLNFGRMETRLAVREGGVLVEDSIDPIVLRAPSLRWEVVQDGLHHTARAEVDLSGGPVVLVLGYGLGTLRTPTQKTIEACCATVEFWEHWAKRLVLPSVAPEHAKRSALLLRGLVHGPSGAIAAAATTSLPEALGGVRNWDYRYCWPRDAAIAARALVLLGSNGEAMRFLDWLLEVVEHAVSPDRIHPLYTLTGHELNFEGEIGELPGYAMSRPVRIGNAAAHQVQLDVFGPVVELVHELAVREAPLSPSHWRVVEAMVRAVEARWREPDHGIWEIRAARRHHTHSKVMCWLAVDRAIKTSSLLLDKEPESWVALREAIAKDLLDNGAHPTHGWFTGWYGSEEIDAAALHVGLSGLLAPDDPRFARTIESVERSLKEGAGVYRYKYDDGLPGSEGAFVLCTAWLVLSYLKVGRKDDARALFDQMLGFVGPTGLMPEEFSVHSGRGLGNVPQAYSHAGLIECAAALSRIA